MIPNGFLFCILQSFLDACAITTVSCVCRMGEGIICGLSWSTTEHIGVHGEVWIQNIPTDRFFFGVFIHRFCVWEWLFRYIYLLLYDLQSYDNKVFKSLTLSFRAYSNV